MFNRLWSLLRTAIIIIVLLALLMAKRRRMTPSTFIAPEAKELIAIATNRRQKSGDNAADTTPSANEFTGTDADNADTVTIDQSTDSPLGANQQQTMEQKPGASGTSTVGLVTDQRPETLGSVDGNASNTVQQQDDAELLARRVELEQHLEEVMAYGDASLDAIMTISYYPEHRPELRKVFKVIGREVYGSLSERGQYTAIERQISKRMIGYQPGVEMRVIVNQRLERIENEAVIDSLSAAKDPEAAIAKIQQAIFDATMDPQSQEVYYATIISMQPNGQ